MDTLWQDVRYGLRMLRKNPGFTIAAVLTLALGIGLNSAIFSVVNAVLFKPLPVEKPEELAGVYNTAKDGLITHEPMAYPDYADLRDQSRSFTGLAGYGLDAYALESGEESQFVLGDEVTGNFFTTLGVRAARGRVFTAEEDRVPGANPVVVLSYHAWQNRFGGDPNIIGRVIRVNGTPLTIIGVAEPAFTGMIRGLQSEMWVPMMMSKVMGRREQIESRRARWMFVIGRLKPGVSFAQANAEVQTIGQRLAMAYPDTNKDRAIGLLPAGEVRVLPGVDRVLYAVSFVLLAVVGLVLLIASANVANMLLARATARRKEIAVRLAMGASRWRLVRQLLVESLLLSLGGGGVALLLAAWSNAALSSLLHSPQSSYPVQIALGLAVDFRVVGYTLALAALTAVLFGLAPALGASRTDLATALKDESGTTSASHGRRGLRNTLVVAQVSLSLVLLIGAGLSVRSLLNAHRIDPGFRMQGVATAAFAPELRGYKPEQCSEFFRRLQERVRALPGVEDTAFASHLPLAFEIRTTNAASEANSALPVEQWPDIDTAFVGPDYFETMGIPILRGRGFREEDASSARNYVVVNESLATRFWPGQDPLGQRVIISKQRVRRTLEDQGRIAEVVGVARNGKYRTLGEEPRPYLYQSNVGRPSEMDALIVRTSGDPRALLPAIRQQARNVDSMVPVISIRTLAEATSAAMLFPRVGAALFGLFGLLGLALASVGLYGVLAYVVSQRTHEIGIRMALGAQPGDILKLIVGQGLALTLVGVGVGLAGAVAVTRVIEVLLYGISPTDVPTFAGVSIVLLAVAALACYIPARRAARVEPMVALRYQ